VNTHLLSHHPFIVFNFKTTTLQLFLFFILYIGVHELYFTFVKIQLYNHMHTKKLNFSSLFALYTSASTIRPQSTICNSPSSHSIPLPIPPFAPRVALVYFYEYAQPYSFIQTRHFFIRIQQTQSTTACEHFVYFVNTVYSVSSYVNCLCSLSAKSINYWNHSKSLCKTSTPIPLYYFSSLSPFNPKSTTTLHIPLSFIRIYVVLLPSSALCLWITCG